MSTNILIKNEFNQVLNLSTNGEQFLNGKEIIGFHLDANFNKRHITIFYNEILMIIHSSQIRGLRST